MDTIFNDLSIDEQFQDADEFVESLHDKTLPVLAHLKKNDNALLIKSQNIFSRNIFHNKKFGDFISIDANSYAELTLFKHLLVNLIDDPFWEQSPKTDVNAQYSSDFTGIFTGQAPNCLSEALERKCNVFSLEHQSFNSNTIDVLKEDNSTSIPNFFNYESLSEILFVNKEIGFCEYLLSKKYETDISFLSNNNKYYADSCFNDGEITIDDTFNIYKDFKQHISYIVSGTPSSFTKSITHKGITYFEFRSKLSGKREFRIFYTRKNSKIIYLNSLLKKTQTTPDHVKDYTIKLIKEHIT